MRELHRNAYRGVRTNGCEHARERRLISIAVQSEIIRGDATIGGDRRRFDDQETRARERELA